MPDDLRRYLAHERLLDGRPVVIRAIREDDKEALAQGFRRLSARSVYQRFFAPKQSLSDAELEYLTELDFERHVALLAVVGTDGADRAVGVGRFVVDPGGSSAEVALTVDDEHQGLGIGTLLLSHLAVIGRRLQLSDFHAVVLGTNQQMLDVFARCGLPMKRTISRGEASVRLSLEG